MLEKHIGKALADVRNAKGLTQKAVSESLGKHFSWVSIVENGRRSLDLPVLQELCSVLEVSVIDITDRAYFEFRDEITQFLREKEARLPDDPAGSSDFESRIAQFMKDGASLFQDVFRLLLQPSQVEILRTRLSTGAPPSGPADPPRRRGRPPSKVNSNPRKGSPGGKKR
jgi:transcriptional regulator with XRE-family HTH domain